MAKYEGVWAKARILIGYCEEGEIVTSDGIAGAFASDDGVLLKYSEVRSVKSAARKIALKRCVYWSYDPLVKGYRVCPAGDRETADRMSAFEARGANKALGAAKVGWAMRRAAKLTTTAEVALRTDQLTAIMMDIETLAKEIES